MARLLHAPPPLTACGSAAAATEANKTGGLGTSSSSLSSYADGEGHRDTIKKMHKHQAVLIFLSFTDLLLFLFFSVLNLLLSTNWFFSFSFSFFSVSGGGKTRGAASC